MVQFFVQSQTGVNKIVSKHGVTHVLSIVDIDNKPAFIHPHISEQNTLRMKFEDTYKPTDRGAPNAHHIEVIAKWFLSLPENAVVAVHCYAGVSRSSACAMFGEVLLNKVKPQIALARVLAVRPQAAPNELIAKLADEWMQKHMGFVFDPSMEEVAKKHLDKYMISKFGKSYR